MPSERFYIDTPLNVSEIILSGAEFHHLVRVMRAQPGDVVELVNGQGELASATIQTIGKESASLTIASHQQEKKGKEIILAQAIPRLNHLEWIIEKGTELGVSCFWLFPGDYSEKRTLTSHQQDRLKLLSIAAMKQCGRLFLPPIIVKSPLIEWTPFSGSLLYGDTKKSSCKISSNLKEPIVVFIGPEKGFSSKEIDALEQTLKANGIKLHDNILRTETAGMVALAQLYLYQTPP